MDANYIEIRRVVRGPTPETAAMTLVVSFSFSEASVDRFKALIPWHDRRWIMHERCWYAMASYLEAIKDFAKDFDGGMFIDGERWENLRTGQVMIQGTLFDT